MERLFFIFIALLICISAAYGAVSAQTVYDEQQENPDIVYPIVGESKNLSPSEKEAMESSRRRIAELTKANKGKVFVNGPTTRKAVALTFDDGPYEPVTSTMLDILKSTNVRASFFFVGSSLNYAPEIVKRADREGHLVLNHSFSHPEFFKLSPAEISSEAALTNEKIFSLIGKMPAIIRPPYGNLSQPIIDQLSKDGYKIALWSIDTLDWSQPEKENITKNVLNNVRPGDIILMHSSANKKATAEALPEIIQRLREMGYELLTLAELLGISAYK